MPLHSAQVCLDALQGEMLCCFLAHTPLEMTCCFKKFTSDTFHTSTAVQNVWGLTLTSSSSSSSLPRDAFEQREAFSLSGGATVSSQLSLDDRTHLAQSATLFVPRRRLHTRLSIKLSMNVSCNNTFINHSFFQMYQTQLIP